VSTTILHASKLLPTTLLRQVMERPKMAPKKQELRMQELRRQEVEKREVGWIDGRPRWSCPGRGGWGLRVGERSEWIENRHTAKR